MKILIIGASITILGAAVMCGAELPALNDLSKEESSERPSVQAPEPVEKQDGPESEIQRPDLLGFADDGTEIRAVLDAHGNIAATGTLIS